MIMINRVGEFSVQKEKGPLLGGEVYSFISLFIVNRFLVAAVKN